MTLREMKVKVLSLIEELNPESQYLTDDPDISAKINDVINQIQFECARIKKIPAKMTYTVGENKIFKMTSSMYQVYKIVGSDFDIFGKEIVFPDDFEGKVTIYYYKYPERITPDTPNDYEFELDDDILECMPYGIAGDILKADPSVDYSIYQVRYETMLNRIDNRNNVGIVYIESLGDI